MLPNKNVRFNKACLLFHPAAMNQSSTAPGTSPLASFSPAALPAEMLPALLAQFTSQLGASYLLATDEEIWAPADTVAQLQPETMTWAGVAASFGPESERELTASLAQLRATGEAEHLTVTHPTMGYLRVSLSVWSANVWLMIMQAMPRPSAQVLAQTRVANHLLTVLEEIPSTFCLLNTDLTISYANRPLAEVLGLPLSQIIGQPILSLYASSAAFSGMLIEALGSQTQQHRELQRVNDGVWYEVDVYPLEDGLAVIATNIDERKQQEQSLQKLNDTKDRFFSIIAHDLRSPLSSIIGLTDLAINYPEMTKGDQWMISLKTLNVSVRTMYRLLDNLLSWARLQMNDMKMMPGHHPIHNLIEFNLDLFAPKAAEKNIKLHYFGDQQLYFFADQEAIDTVVRNLLSNAIKFTSLDGEVQVQTRREGHQLVISVSDNGMGMDPSTMAGLFEVGSKNHSVGTAGEKGTNLGLKLAKELLSQNQGAISVQSTAGQGATFTIVIPIGSAMQA
jgi:PAS domain S-box-containing protein